MLKTNQILICLVSLFLLTGLHTNAQQSWPLYGGKIPNSKGCPDQEVTEKTGRHVVRNVSIPTLTLVMPSQPVTKGTAIIICPGGGYSNLSIEDGGIEAAKEFAAAGIVAFVLKYRTSNPECNENNSIVPLQDLQQAIYQVKLNAAKWNVDSAKVGVLGFSAGGHLATLAATQYEHPQIEAGSVNLKPAFTILAYPVISFTDALTSKNSKTRSNLLGAKLSAEQVKWFSPELNVNAFSPPAFLVHASDDSTSMVNNSITYYQALQRFHVPAKMLIYQKGGHGFAMYNVQEKDHWGVYAIEWLKLNHFLN